MDVGRDRVPMLTAVTKDVVLISSWRKSSPTITQTASQKHFLNLIQLRKNGFVLPATVLNQLMFAYDSYDIFSINFIKVLCFQYFLSPLIISNINNLVWLCFVQRCWVYIHILLHTYADYYCVIHRWIAHLQSSMLDRTAARNNCRSVKGQ